MPRVLVCSHLPGGPGLAAGSGVAGQGAQLPAQVRVLVMRRDQAVKRARAGLRGRLLPKNGASIEPPPGVPGADVLLARPFTDL